MAPERIHVYELLDPLQRGGPGRLCRGRVVEKGGPLEHGTSVVVRSVGGAAACADQLLAKLVEVHGLTRRIVSPNVLVSVDHGLSVGPSGKQFWSVAPWVEGRTLADILNATDVVPDPLTEAIFKDVVAGLASAHAAGVVGIGLSPDAILLRADGSASLVDPGFGPAVGTEWPATGKPPAAMMCAAPEVLQGGVPDVRSDLFSLGAILYRCMTGRWHRPEDAKVLHVHALEMDAMRPTDERPKCSHFLSEVVYALLRASREDRITSTPDLESILRDRRRSAWWLALHVDPEARADESFVHRPPAPEPAATPIPAATQTPDRDWWSQRLAHPGPFVPHPARCIGRDAEIAALMAPVLRLAEEGGAVVLVEGTAGAGKTRVLDAFLERLTSLPAQRTPFVLRGEQRRVGVGRPYGAFTEALTRWLHDDRIADASDVLPLLGESSGVAAAFAAVLSSEAPPPEAAAIPRDGLPLAFLRCLRTMTERSPVVVVIDNLQWADPEVLDLFAYFARVAMDLPLLLVGSFRPSELPDALAAMVAAVRPMSCVRHLRLEPLDADHLAQVAREMVVPDAAAIEIAHRVHATLGGAPEGLVETLWALEAEGYLVRRPDGTREASASLGEAALPATLHEAVRRRMDALDPRERLYLASAGVQGVTFDSDVARIASGFDARTAMQVLGELTGRGIVSGTGIARRVTSQAVFDHLLDLLDDASLADRHEATAAAFLESRNPEQLPPSRIHGILSYRVAWHYLLSGRAARGLLYVNAAVEHLRGTCRHGDGERLTALACRVIADDASRTAELIDLLLERGRFLGAQGRLVEQREALDEALMRARERRDLLRESRILLDMARAHLQLGEAARADSDARQALACAHRSGETDVELRIHVFLAQTAFRESRCQDARSHYAEALEIARRRSDTVAESEIHHGLGLVAQAVGAFDQAEESYGAALAAHRRRGDLAREADTLSCLGNLAASGGDLVRAEGCLRRALAIHVALGDGNGETRVLGLLAMVLQEGGRLVDAREAHRACLERARCLDARQSQVVALLNLATVDGFLGRLDDARDAYGEALLGAQLQEDVRLQGYALTGLGEIARQRGNFDIARDMLSRAMHQFRRTQDPSGLAAALLAAGRLETFAGESEAARPILVEAHRLADQQNARQVTAVADSLLALLSARLEDSDDAERRIAESGLALSDIRASDATRVEMLFIHSLVLRVLGRPVEAGRKLFQAEATLLESFRGLPDEDRDRVLLSLTPNREILAGAEAARSALPRRVPGHSETVAV